MRRLEYQFICKTTGAYHGANQATISAIAAVEPLNIKLRGLAAA